MSTFFYCVIIDRESGGKTEKLVTTGHIRDVDAFFASKQINEMYPDATETRIIKEYAMQES